MSCSLDEERAFRRSGLCLLNCKRAILERWLGLRRLRLPVARPVDQSEARIRAVAAPSQKGVAADLTGLLASWRTVKLEDRGIDRATVTTGDGLNTSIHSHAMKNPYCRQRLAVAAPVRTSAA
jgi:hypothetical protein